MSEKPISNAVSIVLNQKEKGVYLVMLKLENYDTFVESLFNEVLDKRIKAIYVTMKVPAITILNRFKDKETIKSKLCFIDCISKYDLTFRSFDHYLLQANAPECVFIKSPKSLVELSLTVNDKAITGEYKFLFFDSLSALFEHNPPETAHEFTSWLSNKLVDLEFLTVFMIDNEENRKEILPRVQHLFNEVITV